MSVNSIDVLKLVMAIVVVAIHTDPIYYYNGGVKQAYNLICSFAVPIFFLSSGYLISMKCELSDAHIYIISRQLKKVGIMYIKWMLIYTPLLIVHIFLTNDKCSISFIGNEGIKYFRNLIFVGSQYNSYQLWYLLSFLYVLIILLLATKVSTNRKYSLRFLVIVITVALILMNIINAIQGSSNTSLQVLQKLIKITIQDSRLLSGFVYIPLGMLIYHYYHNLNSQSVRSLPIMLTLFILGTILRIFVTDGVVLRLISIVSFFCVVTGIKTGKDGSQIYIVMRKMSTYIYLIHMYVWTIYYMIAYGQKTYGMDSFLVTSMVSVVISLALIMYQSKKYSRKSKISNV